MTTQSPLSSLRAAVETEEMAQVVSAMDRIDRRFAMDRGRDRREHGIAVVVLDALSANDPARSAVREYFETTTTVETARIDLQQSALEFVFQMIPSAQLLERIDETLDAYSSQRNAFSAIQAERSSLTLPAIITLHHIEDIDVPAGRSVDREVVVRNDGDRSASSLDVTVESPVPSRANPSAIETIEAGGIASLEVEMDGTESGSHRLSLSVANETVGDAIDWNLVVVEKGDWIERAIGIITRLVERQFVDGSGHPGIHNQLRETNRRLVRIARDIERNRRPSRAIDSSLHSVERRVSATQQTVAERTDDDPAAAILDDELTTLRETISNAIEADAG